MRCRLDDLRRHTAIELCSPVGEIVATSLADVLPALREVDARAAAGCHVAGFVAYEAAPAFDAALTVHPGGDGLPLCWFGVFGGARAVDPVEPPPHPSGARWAADTDQAAYLAALARVKAAIAAGWTYQVNLTARFRSSDVDDPFELYRQLATAQGGAHNAYLETDDWAVACGSPELFFDLRGGLVTTRPMKGTAPRGRYGAEDLERASALERSAKERAENLMIVDLLRNDLGRVAETGSVAVPALYELERYPTVWQMTSTVTATVPARSGVAELFGALFPCGSVTGAPKASTMSIVAELETSPRGPYCGAVGHVAPGRDGGGPTATFAVAIRTAVVDRARSTAVFGAGGGITWDSVPEAEWGELAAKRTVLDQASARFELVETLGHHPIEGYRNLGRHLDRLAASAAYFGTACDPAAIRRSLEAAAARFDGPTRVRLALEPSGGYRIEAAALVADAGGDGPLRLEVDPDPVDRRDPMLFHKTDRRRPYDERLARHPAADDVVLVNGRGEVTETTRANLLVSLDGRWWTPPVDCGLLAGVGRAVLVEGGEVAERSITLADLARCDGVATVSSLRGRRPAVLAGEVPTAPARPSDRADPG